MKEALILFVTYIYIDIRIHHSYDEHHHFSHMSLIFWSADANRMHEYDDYDDDRVEKDVE